MLMKFKQFMEDVRTEFKRVHWPNREATLKSTSVVLLLSTMIAIFLGVADLGLSTVMRLIIS